MKYLVFVLLIYISAGVNAQTIQVGPSISARLATSVFDNPEIKEFNLGQWAPGFSAGVTTTMQASKIFGLTTEALYHYQIKQVSGTDNFSYFREKLHFIKVPVLLQYTYPINRFQAYALVGPVVNYWIRGKGKALVPELVEGDLENGVNYTIAFDGNSAVDRFYVSDPNRLQLGIQVGLGVAIPMQRNHLKVDARFEWGHTNMAKDYSSYSPFAFYDITLEQTFHSVSLSCAYVFTFDLFKITHKGKSTKEK